MDLSQKQKVEGKSVHPHPKTGAPYLRNGNNYRSVPVPLVWGFFNRPASNLVKLNDIYCTYLHINIDSNTGYWTRGGNVFRNRLTKPPNLRSEDDNDYYYDNIINYKALIDINNNDSKYN